MKKTDDAVKIARYISEFLDDYALDLCQDFGHKKLNFSLLT